MPYDSTDIIEHFKQRGEWAELLFMARAAEQGLSIVRPWGDSSPYDVAIEHRGYLLRVQIKSTRCHHTAGAYKCHIDSNGVPYREGMLDFIAAYVIPAQVWYIIPFDATRRTTRAPQNARCSRSAVATRVPGTPDLRFRGWQNEVLLAPHRPKSKYAKYKEAWHLLRPDPTAADCPRCGRAIDREPDPDKKHSHENSHDKESCPLRPGETCPISMK